MVRRVLEDSGISVEDALYLDLFGPPPAGFNGRRFTGSRWSLRRYLLTSPELSKEARPADTEVRVVAPLETAAEPRSFGQEEIAAGVGEVLAERLGRPRSEIDAFDDLRLLGVDSLGAMEIVSALERKLGISVAEHEFAPSVVFKRSGLIAAAARAAERRVGPKAGASEPDPVLPAETLAEWTDMDLRSVLERNIREAPTRYALKFLRSSRPNDYRYLGWREIGDLAAGYLHMYRERGLAKDAVITLALPTGPELIGAFVGAILGDYIPSISAFPSEKLAAHAFAEWFGRTVTRSGSPFVLCTPELEPDLSRALAGTAPTVAVSSTVAAARAWQEDQTRRPLPDRSALLQQSSGTTGLKKAVMLSSRAVLAQIWLLSKRLELRRSDVIVSWLPVYHDMGLIACLMMPLLAGIASVQMSPFDWVRRPELLLDQLSEERGTLCWLPNFAEALLARRIGPEVLARIDLSSVRAVVSCSEPITGVAMEQFAARLASAGLRRSALASSYAMAETTFAVTQTELGASSRVIRVSRTKLERDGSLEPAPRTEQDALELVSSGAPLPGFEIAIAGDDGARLPDGRVGEIRVRGPSLMDGYFADPEETAKSLKEGWYHSGDLGALLDGELYVTGRKKDMIIVAGQNVYPHFIEEATHLVPGVRAGRVVAFGVFDDAESTERLVIMAEPEQGYPIDQVGARISEEVFARFQIAAEVHIVTDRSLKKSTSGKLSRSANRALYLELRGDAIRNSNVLR
jgi:acyl-CoA synthetase (AMP-forming)/AMP-acid ligase II/acyl carrier protein